MRLASYVQGSSPTRSPACAPSGTVMGASFAPPQAARTSAMTVMSTTLMANRRSLICNICVVPFSFRNPRRLSTRLHNAALWCLHSVRLYFFKLKHVSLIRAGKVPWPDQQHDEDRHQH